VTCEATDSTTEHQVNNTHIWYGRNTAGQAAGRNVLDHTGRKHWPV